MTNRKSPGAVAAAPEGAGYLKLPLYTASPAHIQPIWRTSALGTAMMPTGVGRSR